MGTGLLLVGASPVLPLIWEYLMLSNGNREGASAPGRAHENESSGEVEHTPRKGRGKTEKSGRKEEKARRMSFLFGAETIERMEQVKELTNAGSYSDIMRNALLLYEDYVKSPSEGYEYYKRRIDIDNRPVILPLTGGR